MAPEQHRGIQGEYNYLADMYSLGLILYEMWCRGFYTFKEMDYAFSTLK